MNLLINYGTRPEYIKLKPLIKELENRIPYKTLFTGQQLDLVDAHGADYTKEIKDGDNRLDSIVTSLLNIDSLFKEITHVVVQGDTTSALAIAMAAFHRNVPVIHVEAGLRTYDVQNPYPEEFNRQAISRIASINFCPTEQNRTNLIMEQVNGDIFVVGNTVLDGLRNIHAFYTDDVLVTLHRRENLPIMDQWFRALSNVTRIYPKLKFILPLHPNPAIQKHRALLQNVKVVDPLEYGELLKLLAKVKFIITDSGGLQEEATFLGKKAIVCRKTTERPEGLGTHLFLCKNPKDLADFVLDIGRDFRVTGSCPFGDGKASKRIVDILGRY